MVPADHRIANIFMEIKFIASALQARGFSGCTGVMLQYAHNIDSILS